MPRSIGARRASARVSAAGNVGAMDRLLVVANAAAGGTHSAAVESAVAVLRTAADVEVADTEDVSDLVQVLAARDGRTVVVVGGDGSLHAVVAVLYERGWLDDTVVGLVPLGTGNDFARGAEIPLNPEEAARSLVEASPRRVDLVLDDRDRVVVNAVHVGVGVDAAEEARALKPRFGRFGYVLGAVRAGFRSPGRHLRIAVDGHVLANGRRYVLQVAVNNGRFVGGGTALAPDAVIDDGLADVLVSFAVSRPRRMAYALRVRLGQHPRSQDVVQVRGRDVVVEARRPFRWNVDGELEGPARRRGWRVQPGAWTMLLPAESPETPGH